jgi:phosphate transport system protein
MSVHLERQIDKIKGMITAEFEDVAQAVHRAIEAAEQRDAELAQKVIEHDAAINQAEIDIEEECLHTLACYQPVAFDLRYLVAVLKMNNELERIEDLAVNIAEQAKFLASEPPAEFMSYINGMSGEVNGMVERALTSMLEADAEKADAVRAADDRVDAIHRRMYEQVERAMPEHPDQTRQLMHVMNISKHLERIADLACNIAEDVIYVVRGHILRHRNANPPAAS